MNFHRRRGDVKMYRALRVKEPPGKNALFDEKNAKASDRGARHGGGAGRGINGGKTGSGARIREMASLERDSALARELRRAPRAPLPLVPLASLRGSRSIGLNYR